MYKKLIFLLLSAFLLAQCCQLLEARSVDNNESKSSSEESDVIKKAAPSKKSESSESNSSSEETDVTTKTAPPKKSADSSASSEESELTERAKLVAFTLGEMVKLGNNSVSQGKILFKNTLGDLAVVKVKSESLEEHMTKLTQFVEKVNKFEANPEDPIELFSLMEEMGDILENCTTETMKAPNSEDLLVETTLKKNGWEQFNAASEKDFKGFAERFEKKLVHYFDTLSEKEKENEAKMIDWYKEYKMEKNLEKKLELLPKFMESF